MWNFIYTYQGHCANYLSYQMFNNLLGNGTSTRNVCVFTYSHLSLIVSYSIEEGQSRAEELIHEVLKTIPALNPSKDAFSYWASINKTMLGFSKIIEELWKSEKEAALESINIAKEESLVFLAKERETIMRLSHKAAVLELVRVHKIQRRIKTVESITDNGILGMK